MRVQPLINGLRLFETYDNPPPGLVEYKKILEYQVYTTPMDALVYVILDHNQNKYYAFRNEESKNLDADLEWCIRVYIIKALI